MIIIRLLQYYCYYSTITVLLCRTLDSTNYITIQYIEGRQGGASPTQHSRSSSRSRGWMENRITKRSCLSLFKQSKVLFGLNETHKTHGLILLLLVLVVVLVVVVVVVLVVLVLVLVLVVVLLVLIIIIITSPRGGRSNRDDTYPN